MACLPHAVQLHSSNGILIANRTHDVARGRWRCSCSPSNASSSAVVDRLQAAEAVVSTVDSAVVSTVVSTVDSAANSLEATASISRLAMYNAGSSMRLTSSRSSASLYQQSASQTTTSGRSAFVSVLSSTLVVGATVITAVVAAVRSKLKTVRECSCCQGYGVERCKLCEGKGTIMWEGKMAHREPCPMCLGRRLVKCSNCGGGILFSRSLFTHKANKGEDALMETLQTLTTPSMRLFGRRPGNEQEDARIAESDEYSKEILTD